MQHLAIFVPWQKFLGETAGDINSIWERRKLDLSKRMLYFADNIQLLRRSAEDVKSDARQWAALSGESNPTVDAAESGTTEKDEAYIGGYRSDNIGSAIRLIDVLRRAVASKEITAGSKEICTIIRQLYRFEVAALSSTDELHATMISDYGTSVSGRSILGTNLPPQEQLRSIKSQQTSLSREKEKMIQGIQSQSDRYETVHDAAVYNVLSGFGEQDIRLATADSGISSHNPGPSTSIQFGTSTSFLEAGRQLAEVHSFYSTSTN